MFPRLDTSGFRRATHSTTNLVQGRGTIKGLLFTKICVNRLGAKHCQVATTRGPTRGTHSLHNRESRNAVYHTSLHGNLAHFRGVSGFTRVRGCANHTNVSRTLFSMTTGSSKGTNVKSNATFPGSTSRPITTFNLRRRVRVLPNHRAKTRYGNRKYRVPHYTGVLFNGSHVRGSVQLYKHGTFTLQICRGEGNVLFPSFFYLYRDFSPCHARAFGNNLAFVGNFTREGLPPSHHQVLHFRRRRARTYTPRPIGNTNDGITATTRGSRYVLLRLVSSPN